ncbi:MAG: glycosyltransferase [Sphaerobacter sp.]|nr:glycosyltransferase [Sphaerobacter sp.]
MLLENGSFPKDFRVSNEARALTAAGYRVTVICPAVNGQPLTETVDGVRVYRYPAPPAGMGTLSFLFEYGYSLAAMAVLSLIVRLREGFDIVHANNPPDALALIAAAYRPFGARVIFDHHDLAPEMYEARFGDAHRPWLYRAQELLEILACRLSHQVIASNESYKRREMERSGLPADRITVVRNGPDPEEWRAVAPDPELRARGKTIIGFAGTMGYQDGIDYLLRALHHLVHDLGRRDAFCVLIGEGDVRLQMMRLAHDLDLDDYVWFTGWIPRDDLLRYLSTADICVVPDPSNPFTRRSTMVKLVQYLALGKPAVAFDLPEHRVSAGDAAIYVTPNDEYSFALALAELMDDPARRAALGARGRQRVERHLAWQYSVPALLAAYERAQADPSSQPQHRPSTLTRVAARAQRALTQVRPSALHYYALRARSLLASYGLSTARSEQRLLRCVDLLSRYGCTPTFAVPGRVLARHAAFFRELDRLGPELAIHGYDHVDFRRLPDAEAADQFRRAAAAFAAAGIRVEGFRCPYLSFCPARRAALPEGVFRYSSNRALWWDVVPGAHMADATPVLHRLLGYYDPEPAARRAALPRLTDGLLEVPVSVPEDLQLYDGLKLSAEAVAAMWQEILRRTHERGELFVLVFHPELLDRSATALEAVLRAANQLQPRVWVAELRSISHWWREKADFAVDVTEEPGGLALEFRATPRATILVRHIDIAEPTRPWHGAYRVLDSRTLHLPAGLRPFVGVAASAPEATVSLLRDQGYIVDPGPEAACCAVYLDAPTLAELSDEVALIKHIESSAGPLVRVWRWPNEARSALCISGDADALSLRDYLARVVPI